MRLWRAKDGNLLRVFFGCPGDMVFLTLLTKIATGHIDKKSKIMLWRPAGGNDVGCEKTKSTAGKD